MTAVTIPSPADLGIRLIDTPGPDAQSADAPGPDAPETDTPHHDTVPLDALVRVALRRNPKRAHLLVSTVLAKHVPTVPALALLAGELLGARVADVLAPEPDGTPRVGPEAIRQCTALLRDTETLGPERTEQDATTFRTALATRRPDLPDVRTIGYAETATALGVLVAQALGSASLHSTRLHPGDRTPAAAFEEAHSHATAHLLLPDDPDWLRPGGTVVLVDDELSTGATARGTVRALHALVPQARWVIASLVDLRYDADRAAMDALADELGAPVDVVALGSGRVELPEGLTAVAADLIASAAGPAAAGPSTAAPSAAGPSVGDGLEARITRVHTAPTRVDRSGIPAVSVRTPRTDVIGAAVDLARIVAGARRVLVLGTEEHMATPLAIADALRLRSDADVRFSTTTRSPIAVFDDPAWPIRSVVSFASHGRTVDGPGRRHAYNVHGFDVVVVVPEPGTDPADLTGADGLCTVLAGLAERVVLVTSDLDTGRGSAGAPRPLEGPAFGSYAPDEVSWLLQDLGDADLEGRAEDRERAIQLEGANYAESLPIEYVPTDAYESLYRQALDRSARRVAEAVGIVTELVLRARGHNAVLVSLARAGTPVGVLMRAWAAHRHGWRLPHYTASIVRGVGIDETALAWLAAHHDPATVVFVDGWTGKGAITRELTAALAAHAASTGVRFRDDLAVLADPAGCTTLFGTRDDFLIPSACLNSTVSGLVSRTVYNRAFTPDGTLHGAKQYREFGDRDRSRAFVDTVAQWFDAVADDVDAAVRDRDEAQAQPDWRGMRTVEAIGARFGIEDLHLVKPGVGETTRVLLRRVPWQVLVRDPHAPDVAHIVALAADRGVPVVTVPDLAVNCVGLIHPLGSRVTDQTGTADGTS